MNDTDVEFPLRPDLIYLNHAAVAPWPKRCAEAVQRFTQENVTTGALNYPRWNATEQQLKQRLVTLLNAPSVDDIALLKNTSEALSVVAYGLDWQPGDNVVISDQEFPSNRIVWESLTSRGVQVRRVNLHSAATPEDALINNMDARTRVVSISSVQYASGLRIDLQRLGRHCRAHGALFCVDAIQSLGALHFDVQDIQGDFVAADGHKWLLGPEGVAVFYCCAELRERLRLHQFGWHMVENSGNYNADTWTPAHSARRFECGSPNMLGIHALNASVSLLLETSMEEVERRVLENAAFLLEHIAALPDYELITDTTPGRYAGIVTFRHRSAQQALLHDYLTENNVFCAPRGGGVRFSPHYYTPHTQLHRAVEILAGFTV
ncbi:MAG: aminotransferase class V-fold PLP-dependent enzyme [Gammaproteobacteria bacterium]|nr:aminotransferase class V-fold PLP-dependent enzyme [Gammaproteobacteria bacterium]